ncbi:excinuclease ABC subunit UvrA [Rickettsiales endosymbiont of Peranema trichophorum]|uniref:excinuclease ABC subunit UvrA n=1 Tax=Rickettsiales endosymbiont of Peranema trichophorum TaxID=2486577 RepID=UPI001022EB9B|nr:excinuclease ABC subunit UvrA [Rickettsiales endosymbiont of Peranema trichophorum]RZI45418.1 excinuclease ABC subunit UvrA [Rickettsiales endosymbiont of Peranema trichophorum]
MEGYIVVRGAKEHNLKNINVEIPRDQLVAITGVSGSGKSSLAFDTVYAEGQRRYVESLSTYARQFLELQNKPDVELITGLSPAIAIDQKTTSRNPRSTVSTATEIYDYLRLLYARIGIPYSPVTGQPIEKQTPLQMIDNIKTLPEGTEVYILAPLVKGQKGEHRKELLLLKKQGYDKFKIDGLLYEFENLPILDKNKKHSIEVIIDQITLNPLSHDALSNAIHTALKLSNGIVFVEIIATPHGTDCDHRDGEIIIFSENFACPISGFTLTEIEPRIFSFNSPYGACPKCDGLGSEVFFDPALIVPQPQLSLKDGAISPWSKMASKSPDAENKFYTQTLEALSRHYGFSMLTPFNDLSEEIKRVILYGSSCDIEFVYTDGFRKSKVVEPFDGIIPSLEARLLKTESDFVREELNRYQNKKPCCACGGYRLRQESLCIKVGGQNIGELCTMTVANAMKWFEGLQEKLSAKHIQISERIILELHKRLGFLFDVGLEYLTLNRESSTLSGGESQRIRLASQIGSGLSGVLYVLDEPSIGLHQCDNQKLLTTLKNLKNLGNTVIVVEHDEETILAADYVFDIGLGAGVHGGNVIASGTPEEISSHPISITGKYLSGREYIPVPSVLRQGHKNKQIQLTGARANNLRNVDISIPLGTFIAITGVSGSGKSSLIIQTLYKAALKKLHGTKTFPGEYDKLSGLEYIDKIIEIDQSPIGRTPRSNPATYTGAFTPIRDLFASLPESKARGYKSGRFSFNVKGGRCEVCEGDGVLKVEMHFLPDVYVKCEECHGARYNKETLEMLYKSRSIADVLNMTVDDATTFFAGTQIIHEKLLAMLEVGLGYMTVGQSATTLSGGEAQRVKLAKELSRKSTGRTLYILDEPTTGLHSHDIKKLLEVLHKLVDAGNTVLVIEHNLNVIKTADYVIDVGPHGGDKGGEIVVAGTPTDVINCPYSLTGKYLKPYMEHKLYNSAG